MTEQELLQKAQQMGFTAKLADTKDIVFDFSFRKYCEDNVCGHYNVTDTCPPGCGTPQELKDKMSAFPRALVLQTRWDVGDYSDRQTVLRAKLSHNSAMLNLADSLGKPYVMAGGSACTICDPCRQLIGEKCPFPEKKYYCMSAYCIDVSKLAQTCGMDYFLQQGHMAVFGLIAF